jgi:glycosyltransferase involved in cell wall biosynthesis
VLLRYWPTLSETFVAREIAELQARGVRVDVVALGRRSDGAWADRLPDLEVIRPPRAPLAASWWLRPGAHLGWLADQQSRRRAVRAAWVGRQARLRGWDRIHVHFAGEAAEWARVAAALAGIPYSVTVHAVDLFRPRPGLDAVLRDADVVATVSRAHQVWLKRNHGVEAVLVRCGVEPARFGQAPPRGAEPLRLVCVARDVPKKGLDDLVAALEAVPDARLRLVSDAHRLAGPRVVVGSVSPSRVPAVLSSAHAFVLPCRVAPDGDRDGLPVSVLEAMAAGLPVITTAVAGIPEVVDDSVGWLLEPGDPDALARVLRIVDAHPEACARRGRAGRARVLEWDLTVQAQARGLIEAWTAAPVAGLRGAAKGAPVGVDVRSG